VVDKSAPLLFNVKMTKDYRASANLVLSWQDIHRDSVELARRVEPHGPFTGIVAIARGGLVPAAVLARVLDLRMVETVCVASYDDGFQLDGMTILKQLQGHNGAGMLVVDDLVDTGATARVVRQMLPEAHFAGLYAKPEGRDTLDTFVTPVEQDVWIVFPWDADPD
jgi:xanthine phosphoribosyltransferase